MKYNVQWTVKYAGSKDVEADNAEDANKIVSDLVADGLAFNEGTIDDIELDAERVDN